LVRRQRHPPPAKLVRFLTRHDTPTAFRSGLGWQAKQANRSSKKPELVHRRCALFQARRSGRRTCSTQKKNPGGLRFDQSTRQRWQECTNQAVTEGGLHCTHPTWPSLAYYIIHHPLQKLNSRMHHPSLVHNNSTRFKTLFLLFPPRPDLQGFFFTPSHA
jgi:hypothetical protein